MNVKTELNEITENTKITKGICTHINGRNHSMSSRIIYIRLQDINC